MGRIADKFEETGKRGESALVTFVTAGDPDLKTTAEVVLELERSGADVIELGVPFSDPMADGPTIQLSSERALAGGTTLPAILDLVRELRSSTQIPIVLMGYYNPIFIYGAERFAADAAAAGVDGLLIVDLPPEESAELKEATGRHGMDLIFLLTPTSDRSRIETVSGLASGFVYYVSVTGVTGARSEIADTLAGRVTQVKGELSVPLVVGFGISDPAQAGEVAKVSDGVVVGSALVKHFERYQGAELLAQAGSFVKALKEGMQNARGAKSAS
ncbi:tryptophan synthase subunit alpha [Geomesophilobacter sediminis]|uniref:Tryptophan synthase alpha chain n=1 Tax=Geomesophilobacter sediminis TaxID=2798584 RepID=A0A8J7M2Y1_9BACT|nr:tryptophan synthase subunit alpha [Geomesophilobacter sediminis]MBJ6727678.1 tryptophan synthase subunit alpha [Geomesophilobacter sediminis]